ncbi:unnamed protein product [Rangifer tarandus platyrhynchus]|uniref:Uncharacterized protein n=1 Tax=Rangifer tarandus platyrhynchus TaxID=3082113 RepID=A0AC59Z6R8_RANTA
MARGGGGLAGVLRGSGGRREAGSADEPRTEPELERAAGGRAGARRSRAGARARGGGAAGTARRANARRGARAGDRLGRVRGVGAAFLARLGWARASGRGLQERGLRGGGCGGARAPGGAGTCGGGETEPRRVRGKAVLILTPNVFGESCRRGTLEGGGVEATDRLTAAAVLEGRGAGLTTKSQPTPRHVPTPRSDPSLDRGKPDAEPRDERKWSCGAT